MIQYTIEKLYHFKCAECKKWWSVGDFLPVSIVCPFCRHSAVPTLDKE